MGAVQRTSGRRHNRLDTSSSSQLRGIRMPKIVVVHDVEDVDKWLTYSAERAEAIAGMGASNVIDYAAEDGSNTIAITADTDDVDRLLAEVGAPPPELMAVMQQHGVVPPLKVFVQR